MNFLHVSRAISLLVIGATLAVAAPSQRSVITVETVDDHGERHREVAPPTPADAPVNLVVQSVTLPTDGVTAATMAVAQGALAPGELAAGQPAVSIAGPKPPSDGDTDLKVVDLFDPVAPDELPPAEEADSDGVIVVTSGPTRTTDASDSINPFDPRGLRPLKTHETKVRVAAIVHGVRYAAAINGTPAVVGSTIESFVVSHIVDGAVYLEHDKKHFKIPVGKTITILTPER